jgi:hypothetical protein
VQIPHHSSLDPVETIYIQIEKAPHSLVPSLHPEKKNRVGKLKMSVGKLKN